MLNKFIGEGLNDQERKYNYIKIGEMALSLVFIIVGIIFMNSIFSDKKIATILGIIILIEGILNVYSKVMKDSNSYFKLNLVFGIIYIIIAILLFTNLIKFVNYIQIYFGIYLAVNGIKQLVTSIKLKLIGDKSFLITLIMSILIISLGILLMFYPFETFGIIETIGIFAILLGLLNINTANLLKNRVSDIIE